MPVPIPGVGSRSLSTVFTGTDEEMSVGAMFAFNMFQAFFTSIRPMPCS
jgi:hypothetical protein